jgi:AraC-like DNA-binding protein
MRSPFNLFRDLFKPKKNIMKNDRGHLQAEDPDLTAENSFAANKVLALFEKMQPTDIESIVDKFMQKKKPFLLSRYSIHQLSEDTGIAVPDLASYISVERSGSFREFINEYRIHYCQELMEKAPVIKASLFELSIICGFSSQREFSTSFKKVTQTTFSNYKKRHNRGKRSLLTSQSALVLLICGVTGLHLARCMSSRSDISRSAKKYKEPAFTWRPADPGSVLSVTKHSQHEDQIR